MIYEKEKLKHNVANRMVIDYPLIIKVAPIDDLAND